MAQGLGKMNSDTPKPAQITCQSSTISSSKTHGAQRSAIFLCFMVRLIG